MNRHAVSCPAHLQGTRDNPQLLPNRRRSTLTRAVSVALLATAAAPLNAQQLEEVVVTATKRAESVLDVSISMTAMSGEETRMLNLNDIKDLIAFSPGITGNSKDSFIDSVAVRGINTNIFGNAAEPSVGLYVNGLYQGRTGAAVSGLFDVERTEVLRGPQGFLFARNSTSGAFNVITEKASTEGTEGFAELDVGERGVLVFEGAVNVPITDNLAMRVAAFHTEEDGYVTNLAGGPDLIAHENQSFRASFAYETDKLAADLVIQYDDRDQAGSVYRLTGRGTATNDILPDLLNNGQPIAQGDRRTTNSSNRINPRDGGEILSAGLFIDYDLGFATLNSVTGYKDHDYEYAESFYGLPRALYEYDQIQEGDYFEQELRLTSNGDGPLSWYAGVSYYEEDIDTTFGYYSEEEIYCGPGNYLNYYYGTETCQEYFDYIGEEYTPSSNGLINDQNRAFGTFQGYSTYIELAYAFSDTFDIAAGIRYSWDEKEYTNDVLPDVGGSLLEFQGFAVTPVGGVSDKQDWSDTTYRLVANWRPNDSTLFFASYTTGYKPGGFDNINFEDIASGEVVEGGTEVVQGVHRPADFEPETVDSYEIGYKGNVADGRMQISLTGFYYEYSDLQSFFSEGPRTFVGNVGLFEAFGSEVEIYAALTETVTLRVGGSWLDSEGNGVQDFCGAGAAFTGNPNVCEGQPIPRAPEYTAFAVLNAATPIGGNGGELFANIAWSWEEDTRADWAPEEVVDHILPFMDQTDIVVGYQQDNWVISGYVENVFDNDWVDGTFEHEDLGGPYPEYEFGPSRPRTAGVRASYSF